MFFEFFFKKCRTYINLGGCQGRPEKSRLHDFSLLPSIFPFSGMISRSILERAEGISVLSRFSLSLLVSSAARSTENRRWARYVGNYQISEGAQLTELERARRRSPPRHDYSTPPSYYTTNTTLGVNAAPQLVMLNQPQCSTARMEPFKSSLQLKNLQACN